MSNPARSAGGVAQELWAEARQHSESPDNVLVVADELLTKLEARLRRWIGAEGYAALLNRSVALTLPHNAALASVSDLHPRAAESSPSSQTAAVFSESETSDAIIALLIVMMEQLGSIVGTDMAVRLVALSAPPNARSLAGHESKDTQS